jgi:hypothetical protein
MKVLKLIKKESRMPRKYKKMRVGDNKSCEDAKEMTLFSLCNSI